MQRSSTRQLVGADGASGVRTDSFRRAQGADGVGAAAAEVVECAGGIRIGSTAAASTKDRGLVGFGPDCNPFLVSSRSALGRFSDSDFLGGVRIGIRAPDVAKCTGVL